LGFFGGVDGKEDAGVELLTLFSDCFHLTDFSFFNFFDLPFIAVRNDLPFVSDSVDLTE